MTNPFQHVGSSGFNPESNSAAGLPASGRRSSYATVASGNAASSAATRSGAAFAHLLNPSSDGLDIQGGSSLYGATRTHSDSDVQARSGSSVLNGSSPPAPWGTARPHLQNFSRAFEMFMNRDLPSADGSGSVSVSNGSQPPRLLSPSYLEGSTYLRKLEDAWRARMLAQRDGASSTQAPAPLGMHGGIGGIGGGPVVGGGHGLHSTGGSAAKLSSSATSHRGGSWDAADRLQPLQAEDGENLPPLPTRWNKDDKYGGLEVLGADGFEVKYTGHRSSGERDHEACAIRADHYMPPQCGIYYFEVTILSRKREDTTIGIGFSSKTVALSRVPGWEPESWGYHGDDGHCFASQNTGKPYGPTFGAGDTIGCGINFNTGFAFFTKNGHYLGTAFREVGGKLYPSVGLKRPGEHVWANFGQIRFQFDIDTMMKSEKAKIQFEIDRTSTAKLAPPRTETDLVQQLVLQFLQHDGYIETARAFAEEIQTEQRALTIDTSAEVKDISIKDDDDANKRQRIRRAILEGDIDRALKYTNAYYPQVLKENEPVYFRLRCRKFIEMIRKDAEMKRVAEKSSASWAHQDNGGRASTRDDQEMELDGSSAWEVQMDGTDDDAAAAADDDGNEDDGDADSLDDDGADDDKDGEDMRGSQSLMMGELLQEAIEYGRELRAEFGGADPARRGEVDKYLEEIFSLLAYPDPWKQPEVSHLLDRSGRVVVAEELNSAILLSLGKSSRAALETVYAQTNVLLEDLRQDGGPGAFVTLQEIVGKIPKSTVR